MEIRGLVVGHILAGVALLAACGGDDEGGALTEREYGDAVRAISDRVADEVMDPAEVIGEAFEFLSPEAAAGVLAEQLPAVIAAYERAVDEIDVLTPPETYAADHARLIAGRRDLVALLQRMLEAAEASDFLRVLALEQERRALARNLASELSADFRDFVHTSEAGELLSAVFGGLEEEETAYLDALNAGMEEFSRRAIVFSQTLRKQFNDTSSFFDALEGAGAGTAFEAAQTAILQIDPPPDFEEDHQRVLRYLEDAVRLDTEVGRSIAEQNIVLFAVSNIGLGRNGGLVAIDVAPSVCGALFSPQRLCRVPEQIPGGDYGAELYATMRQFSARFGEDGRLQQQLNLLTFVSDEELFALVMAVTPDLIAIVDDARDSIGALEPADGMEADHDRLVEYLDETLDTLRSIEDAAVAADRDGVLRGSQELDNLRTRAAADLTDAIAPIVNVHFG